MTTTFPLSDKRDAQALLAHLARHNLSVPGNCAVTVTAHVALVSSHHNKALGTARTVW